MSDSDGPEALAEKHAHNRRERIEAIKRWVAHIEATTPEQWGPEQNAVVDAQVAAARASDLDAEHRRRVERVARELESLEE